MKDSVRGLKRAIRSLKGSLNDPTHLEETREYIILQIKTAEEVLEKMQATLTGS
jgi:hypothetical protein